MATQPEHESLFRFIAIKPAEGARPRSSTATALTAGLAAASPPQAEKLAQEYLDRHPEPLEAAEKELLSKLEEWARRRARVSVSALDPAELSALGLDALDAARARLLDHLAATGLVERAPKLDAAAAIKLIDLATAVLAGGVTDDRPVDEYLSAGMVIIPVKAAPAPAAQISQRKKVAPARTDAAKKLEALRAVHQELRRWSASEKYRYRPEVEKSAPGGESVFHDSSSRLRDRELVVDLRHVEKAHPATRELLRELDVETKDVVPSMILPIVELQIDELLAIPAIEAMPKLKGGRLASCMYSAGVGDLLLVKQKLKAYELTDIAHVENILDGESKERVHRRLTVREEITTEERETETQKDRDLQSTERNEMQSEAEQTVREELELDAGLQVSGSYGPSISFSASLNASYGRTTEEAQRRASTFSREVVEKASEKVREKVRLERIKKLREETEETNSHKIVNSPAGHGHIRGVYRWLNKIYDAQVFNYGKRMMYEFIVPEPAAFYIYAKTQNQNPPGTLRRPEAPLNADHLPLRPTDITTYNYPRYIAQYEVVHAPPPPVRRMVKTFADKQDGEAGSPGRASAIVIPPGYVATAARVTHSFFGHDADRTGITFWVAVGGVVNQFRSIPGVSQTVSPFGYFLLPREHEGEISVLVSTKNVQTYSVGVDVFCEMTADGFMKWQLTAYDAIIQAYQNQLAVYEDKVRAREVQSTSPVRGTHPALNAKVTREELKKLCIFMLRNDPQLDFDAYLDAEGEEPTVELDEACRLGKIIRFLESALEWNNMMYVLYPYFWGRHSKWVPAIHVTDADPEFEAFLKSGAARVQVPVRPGFERALAYFCQTGRAWNGAEPPLREDELYVPIVQEIAESLGRVEEGVPYPPGSEPWEVVVPTTLVVLQNLDEVPAIRDVLTDRVVALTPR